MRRNFLLIVRSPLLTEAHKFLPENLNRIAVDGFLTVFSVTGAPRGSTKHGQGIPFTAGYLFAAEHEPSRMNFGLPSEDSYVLLEVGAATWVTGFSRVREWLVQHTRRE